MITGLNGGYAPRRRGYWDNEVRRGAVIINRVAERIGGNERRLDYRRIRKRTREEHIAGEVPRHGRPSGESAGRLPRPPVLQVVDKCTFPVGYPVAGSKPVT